MNENGIFQAITQNVVFCNAKVAKLDILYQLIPVLQGKTNLSSDIQCHHQFVS